MGGLITIPNLHKALNVRCQLQTLKMRSINKILLFCIFSFFVLDSQGQENICGKYTSDIDGNLNLVSDLTYYWSPGPGCTHSRIIERDSGIFKIEADTIFTFSKQWPQLAERKYLIVKLDKIIYLRLINRSDKILSKAYPGRLNDFEFADGNFRKLRL
ncbi:MAG: hypothetical protein QM791_07860 [Ferruginibacter sp.]